MEARVVEAQGEGGSHKKKVDRTRRRRWIAQEEEGGSQGKRISIGSYPFSRLGSDSNIVSAAL